ncbi:MAG: hypothetical protein AB8U25_02115 [Rickettsiales endosymbiont of Dermacentor nuttalli]
MPLEDPNELKKSSSFSSKQDSAKGMHNKNQENIEVMQKKKPKIASKPAWLKKQVSIKEEVKQAGVAVPPPPPPPPMINLDQKNVFAEIQENIKKARSNSSDSRSRSSSPTRSIDEKQHMDALAKVIAKRRRASDEVASGYGSRVETVVEKLKEEKKTVAKPANIKIVDGIPVPPPLPPSLSKASPNDIKANIKAAKAKSGSKSPSPTKQGFSNDVMAELKKKLSKQATKENGVFEVKSVSVKNISHTKGKISR